MAPFAMHAGPVRPDGLATVLPEWGEPVHHPDAPLPEPVSHPLALWRQWQGGDSAPVREELEQAGYRLTWSAAAERHPDGDWAHRADAGVDAPSVKRHAVDVVVALWPFGHLPL